MDLADAIVSTQNLDGSWNATNAYWWPEDNPGTLVNKVLSTVWALLTLEKAAPPPPTKIEVTKHWSYTNVCFEKDNDLDGQFNEDPVDFEAEDVDGNGIYDDIPIDNDGDGLYNEDDVDCPDGSYPGDPLPADMGDPEDPDDDIFYLEAIVHPKNNKVSSYNPGQFYAVSTVNITADVDQLTIVENYTDVIAQGIGVLNPTNGGGRLVVVKVVDDVAYQIMDANSENVTFSGNVATVVLGPQEADTLIMVYVKFGPGLAKETWLGSPIIAINYNAASAEEEPIYPNDFIMAQATISLDQK
jgi:hypothetical protein